MNKNMQKRDFQGKMLILVKSTTILLLFGLSFLLIYLVTSNLNPPKFYDSQFKYEIDSVEYHPIGGDNTLQTTPYWKCHLKGTRINVTSYQMRSKGDSMEVIEKILIQELRK
jgi:hypothetical protein